MNNPDALGSGARKNVSSVISFDNGASWTSLKAPEKDSNNNNPCDGVQVKEVVILHLISPLFNICIILCLSMKGFCSLHLHGPVTHDENSNGGHSTPINSNSNAIGLVIGVGNVGNSLSDYNSGNVYISRDAGKTWTEARKEAHRWAIGDHGGIIAMVNDEAATDTIM